MYLVYYEVCIGISLLFNGYYYIYLEMLVFIKCLELEFLSQ